MQPSRLYETEDYIGRTMLRGGSHDTNYDDDDDDDDRRRRDNTNDEEEGAVEVDNDAGNRNNVEEEEGEVDEEEEEEEEDDDDEDETTTVPASSATAAGAAATLYANALTTITAVPTLESMAGLRELSMQEAICWQLSSAKPGNGVEQIRDPSLDTYWQSDGQTQPHWIQVHFARRVAISHVCLFLDYSLDESYTPKKITVLAGMTHQDLQEAVPVIELNEPSGWCIFPLQSPPDPLNDFLDDEEVGGATHPDEDDQEISIRYNQRNVVRVHVVRISIQSMHQNGRDTHVRQLRIYGPRSSTTGQPPFGVAGPTASSSSLSMGRRLSRTHY